MQLRSRSLGSGLLLLGCGLIGGAGCSDDGATPGQAGGSSAGEGDEAGSASGGKSAGGKTGNGGKIGGGGRPPMNGGTSAGGSLGRAGGGGTSLAGEAALGGGGAGAGPSVVEYLVPEGGGEVEVMTASGNIVFFTFPASAAGVHATLTPDTSASIGWSDERFGDVIRMEPDGTTFADPVKIVTLNKDVLLFDFATLASKHPAEGLALSPSGDALLLKHFSTLVVVPPEYSCDSQSGWNATPDSPMCIAAGADSTFIEFVCKAYSYCLLINARCGAPPGSTECELGMQFLSLTYEPRDSNGGQYPYCDPPPVGGEGGAGGAGGAASGEAGAGGASAGTGPVAPSVETVLGNTSEVTALRLDGSTLFYAASGSVSSVPTAGGSATPVVASADFWGTFDVDASNVYFSYAGSMYRRAKSGAGSDVDLALTGGFFSDAFVEESGGNLYIASGLKIFKAPVTGNAAVTTLVNSEPSPTSLAVSGTDLFFVTGAGTGTHKNAVMKVPTAGGAATPLIENLALSPRALALSGGYVYYLGGGAISRIPMAGGSAEPVAAVGGSDIAVAGADVYFANDTAVHHVGTTGQIVAPIATSLSGPRLALDSAHTYYSTMSGAPPAPGIFRVAR